MEPPTTDEARVHIDARPEKIYALVADITGMGEWSPECYRCEWLDGASNAVGVNVSDRRDVARR